MEERLSEGQDLPKFENNINIDKKGNNIDDEDKYHHFLNINI